MGDLPAETQFVLLELQPGGPYAVLLPLIDSEPRCGPVPGALCDSVTMQPVESNAGEQVARGCFP